MFFPSKAFYETLFNTFIICGYQYNKLGLEYIKNFNNCINILDDSIIQNVIYRTGTVFLIIKLFNEVYLYHVMTARLLTEKLLVMQVKDYKKKLFGSAAKYIIL